MAVDCHAIATKTTMSGRKVPQEVRHRIAAFVCGTPEMMPQDLMDRGGEETTRIIRNSWPAVQGWKLEEIFDCDTEHVDGMKIGFNVVGTIVTVNMKTDRASLQLLADNRTRLSIVYRGHTEHDTLLWSVNGVKEGRIKRLYIQMDCDGTRDPTPAEFAAHGCDPSATRDIQFALAQELLGAA
jgi:hypothetical protein